MTRTSLLTQIPGTCIREAGIPGLGQALSYGSGSALPWWKEELAVNPNSSVLLWGCF